MPPALRKERKPHRYGKAQRAGKGSTGHNLKKKIKSGV